MIKWIIIVALAAIQIVSIIGVRRFREFSAGYNICFVTSAAMVAFLATAILAVIAAYYTQ